MFLITKSLLEAWQYAYDCSEEYAEEARESFLRALRKEKEEPTEAMLNGIAFENLVYRIANGGFVGSPLPKNFAGAKKVAEIIKGSLIQVRAEKEIEVDGESFLVYGILDALKAGIIYDVKFLNKSMGGAELAGKYRECSQHPAYLYIVPEATEFNYIVSDGEDVYIERYERGDSPEIGAYISWFVDDLKRSGLWELYREFWTAKDDRTA